MIKRYFFTGLSILLPVVVTLFIFNLLITLMTKPFQNLAEEILTSFGLSSGGFVLHLTSKVLILATLVVGTLLVGLLTRLMITHYLFRAGEYIIHRIPIVNKIYKAGQEVVKTLFFSTTKTFSQVVLVPFPSNSSYSIGMITSESEPAASDKEHGGLISVFVPATPNPTMGFMLMFKREQLIFLDMRIDDAVEAVISCGILLKVPLKLDKAVAL